MNVIGGVDLNFNRVESKTASLETTVTDEAN